MWPQHLIIVAPFMGMIGAEAFVAPSSTFVGRSSSSLCAENQSKDVRERLSTAERKLVETKCSLERMVSGPSLSIDEMAATHGMPWSETIGSSDHENPLLYMPFWEWQMDFMKSSLTNLVADDCATADFGYNGNEQKKARIVNQCYKSDEYRKIRMTYYDAGDNTQVFNSVWYPDPAYNLPVLGIDLLAFNRKKYLAIVDFQPLHEDEKDHAQTFEHKLKPIKEQYDSLKGRMSAKFYDETQFFSEQMLFARFDDEKIVERDLLPAFQRYVNAHVKLIRDTTPDMSSKGQQSVLDRQTAYDTYSAERDPATGLFAAMFGKEWAEDFVFDFLFSLSERTEGGLQIPPMGGPPPPQGSGGPPSGNKPETPSKKTATKKESVHS